MSEIVKNAPSCNVEESFLKFPDPNPEADKIPQFNKFFLVHRCICDKIFMKSCSVVLRQTDRQTKRQINRQTADIT